MRHLFKLILSLCKHSHADVQKLKKITRMINYSILI